MHALQCIETAGGCLQGHDGVLLNDMWEWHMDTLHWTPVRDFQNAANQRSALHAPALPAPALPAPALHAPALPAAALPAPALHAPALHAPALAEHTLDPIYGQPHLSQPTPCVS